MFAEKVLKYSWDDAFKFSRDKLFNSAYKSLEQVVKNFSVLEGFEKFDVFITDVKDILKEKAELAEAKKEILEDE